MPKLLVIYRHEWHMQLKVPSIADPTFEMWAYFSFVYYSNSSVAISGTDVLWKFSGERADVQYYNDENPAIVLGTLNVVLDPEDPEIRPPSVYFTPDGGQTTQQIYSEYDINETVVGEVNRLPNTDTCVALIGSITFENTWQFTDTGNFKFEIQPFYGIDSQETLWQTVSSAGFYNHFNKIRFKQTKPTQDDEYKSITVVYATSSIAHAEIVVPIYDKSVSPDGTWVVYPIPDYENWRLLSWYRNSDDSD